MSLASVGQKSIGQAIEYLLMRAEQLLSLNAGRSGEPEVIRLAMEIDPIDPLRLLATLTDTTKIYWRGRRNSTKPTETAGVGIADQVIIESAPFEFSAITGKIANRLRACPESRYYGGFQFHTDRDHSDSSMREFFPAARFILPRFELIRSPQKTELAINLILPVENSDSLSSEIKKGAELILAHPKTIVSDIPTVIGRQDTPSSQTWCERVEKSVASIKNNELQKIVLARCSKFTFSRPLDPWQLLDGFRESEHGRFLFGFAPEAKAAFVCASPELLYSRRDNNIHSEALAGTRPRSENSIKDTELGQKLMNSVKERREHGFVESQVWETLSRLCRGEVTKSEVSLVKLPHVQHMRSSFHGKLYQKVLDADILTALHPTPAVGGHPREKAIAMIYDLETFDRCWYASPVGWIGSGGAEFSVGIRSGVLNDNRLTLYSGAGIVEGSIPLKEWDEIENKIAGFLSLLSR